MKNNIIYGGKTRFYNIEDLNNIKEIMVQDHPSANFTQNNSISLQFESSSEGFEEGLERIHKWLDDHADYFELKRIEEKINKAINDYIPFAFIGKYGIYRIEKIQEKILEDGLMLDKKFEKDKLTCSILDKNGELIYRPLEINFVYNKSQNEIKT